MKRNFEFNSKVNITETSQFGQDAQGDNIYFDEQEDDEFDENDEENSNGNLNRKSGNLNRGTEIDEGSDDDDDDEDDEEEEEEEEPIKEDYKGRSYRKNAEDDAKIDRVRIKFILPYSLCFPL